MNELIYNVDYSKGKDKTISICGTIVNGIMYILYVEELE